MKAIVDACTLSVSTLQTCLQSLKTPLRLSKDGTATSINTSSESEAMRCVVTAVPERVWQALDRAEHLKAVIEWCKAVKHSSTLEVCSFICIPTFK